MGVVEEEEEEEEEDEDEEEVVSGTYWGVEDSGDG